MARFVIAALAVAVCSLVAAPARANHSDLAGQWHLDALDFCPDTCFGTSDSSGHGLNALESATPAPVADGRFGHAFKFGASASAFSVNDSPLLQPANVTLVSWVRRTGDPGTVRYIAAQGADGACGHASYALYTGGSAPGAGGLQFYIWNGSVVRLSPNAGTGMWDGAWHMLAGTYDGAAVRLFVDGHEVGTGSSATGPIAYQLFNNDFTIGNYPNRNECVGLTHFPGDVDETRVYRRALSATEIARLAAHPGPDPPVLEPDPPPGPGPGPGPAPNLGAPAPGPAVELPLAPAPSLLATASFTAPTVVAPLRPVVLDAATTSGAVRLLWDIDGDGRNDVACGANAPVLSLRTPLAQRLDVTLTAVAADGSTSMAHNAVSVAGPRMPSSIARRVPEVATCSSSAGFLLRSAQTGVGLCLNDTTVVFGIVEASGCFAHVDRRANVPAAEARVVDEYYAHVQLPAFAQALCRHGSPLCPELLTKYTALDLMVSRGPVRINGLDFVPRNGASIVLFPGLARVVSSDARVTVHNGTLGTLPILSGPLDLDVKSGKALGRYSPAAGRLALLSFDARRNLPSIGGFSVDGQIDLAFVRKGERRFTEATLRLRLPAIFDAFGGRPPSGEVTMVADNAAGLVLDRLHLAVPEANLGGLRFTDVSFDYSQSGDEENNCSRRWWKAGANVFLGATSGDAGFRLTEPPSQNGIAFCNGGFQSAGGRLEFGAQIPPPQIFPGVLLNEINFAVALNPTLVRGGGRISVADISDITGTFLAVFASPGAPYVLRTADAGRELAGLAGRRLVSTSFALGGTGGVRVPGLGRLELGNAYLLYSYPGYVAFGGGVRVVAPGLSIEGKVDGELAVDRRLFSTYGGVRACIAGMWPCLGLGGWVTSKGMVVCATGEGLHPGAGYHWGDAWPTIWLFDGCKPSGYWVDVRAATAQDGARQHAAAGPLTFTLTRGERGKNVRLQGSGGAPSVEVRGPDGQSVSTAQGDDVAGPTLHVLRQDEGKVTWIGVSGKPGTYTVTPLPDSPPIAALATSRPGDGAVTATVTGSGDRRTLRYDLGAPAGRTVTFFERGAATFRQLGTATSGRGAIRFTPAPGLAGRRDIVAEATIDGVPTPDRVVARYRAAGPLAVAPPRGLRVRRAGAALVVSWHTAPAAQAYGIVVRQRNGAERLLRVGGGRRSARLPGISPTQGGAVTVRALGALGNWSGPAEARFRAVRPPASRVRDFAKLGRHAR